MINRVINTTPPLWTYGRGAADGEGDTHYHSGQGPGAGLGGRCLYGIVFAHHSMELDSGAGRGLGFDRHNRGYPKYKNIEVG